MGNFGLTFPFGRAERRVDFISLKPRCRIMADLVPMNIVPMNIACLSLLMSPPLFTPEEWAAIVKELRLSPRKAQITDLILQDLKDDAIAKSLKIRKSTLRSHLGQMLRQHGVASRVGLIVKVFEAFRRLSPPS
jgi:DNA-binding CsgD family transcriptional regulator